MHSFLFVTIVNIGLGLVLIVIVVMVVVLSVSKSIAPSGRVVGMMVSTILSIAKVVVVKDWGEDPLLAALVQAASVDQDIQGATELLLQSLAARHIGRVSEVATGIQRLLDAEKLVVLSGNVPVLRFLGQIASMAH